jgi:hypothetical protein
MSRQPYLSVVRAPRGSKIDIGSHVLGQRPKLQSIICDCLLSWPFVEGEMSVIFGCLLNTDNAAAVAVYQTLRRSTNQRDAIISAANASLVPQDSELIEAVLLANRSIEADRNAFAHGCFGTSTKLENDLVWQEIDRLRTIQITLHDKGF